MFYEVQEEGEQRTGRVGKGRKMRCMCSPLTYIQEKTQNREKRWCRVESRRETLEYGAKVCEDGRLVG